MITEAPRSVLAGLLFALLFSGGPLLAADAPAVDAPAAAPAEDAPTLAKPPELREFVEATLPPGTEFPAPEVVVVLALDVDEAGRVTAVRLVAGAGAGFDEAALAAARAFAFTPGVLSTGEPVPVEVTYRYRFQAPPPPPVRFTGTLLERGTRRPLSDVVVAARAGGARIAEAVTDRDGRFALEVPVATFELVAVPAGHDRLSATVEAAPGEERAETFYLEGQDDGSAIVIRADRVRREVTKRVIPKELVMTAPGTGGDTLKVVQSLPGVSRSSFDLGQLVLRGANPGDSKIFVEGLEIPIAYHWGGVRSAVNSRFLEALEFVPGNFASDFGRAIGGIVDMQIRDPADDAFRGEIDLNTYDAGFGLEGPLGGGWSMGGAFHRSYIDAILPLVVPDDADLSFSTAPRYYDYQLLTTWKPSRDQRLRIFWFGSLDKMVAVFDEPQDDPSVRDSFGMQLMFHSLMVQHEARIAPWLREESVLSARYIGFEGEFGPKMSFDEDDWLVGLRSAWTFDPLDWLSVRAGVDLEVLGGTYTISSVRPPKEGDMPAPLSTQEVVATKATSWGVEPGFFVEADFRPVAGLDLVPSLRVDYFEDPRQWTVDPRFVARWQALPGTLVKAGVGLYHQAPDGDESNAEFGTPSLHAKRAIHTSVGIEQRVVDGLDVELTGYYKWLDDLVVRNPAAAYDADAPYYTNAGEGRVYGLELLVRARFEGVFQGWIAYTFQRSLRSDGYGEAERPFDFDQPHILTALGTFELGRGWTAGFRFRLVSGNPDTPVERAVYDAGTGTWVPVYGRSNSERLGLFHQLDLRVDKTWTFDLWKLNLYLEVQNVYLAKNPEGHTYQYDYSKKDTITGLPILPMFGLRGEW